MGNTLTTPYQSGGDRTTPPHTIVGERLQQVTERDGSLPPGAAQDEHYLSLAWGFVAKYDATTDVGSTETVLRFAPGTWADNDKLTKRWVKIGNEVRSIVETKANVDGYSEITVSPGFPVAAPEATSVAVFGWVQVNGQWVGTHWLSGEAAQRYFRQTVGMTRSQRLAYIAAKLRAAGKWGDGTDDEDALPPNPDA